MDTLTVQEHENIPDGLILANRATAEWIARSLKIELEVEED